jgi:hypothetical protein
MNLMISNILIAKFYGINLSDENIDVKTKDGSSVLNLEISSTNPQNEQEGKIYSEITSISSDCYINRYQPSLNSQPNLYIPNYILSHANMSFDNITATNYTRIIEIEPTEYIESVESLPTYIYQKFSVELSQYVNNVSIFIQDTINPLIYNETNSWEVAILNCSNDINITPNSTLGSLTKPHPLNSAAHWELFDFESSEDGPIYLNTSNTNWTIENGIKKYWFAFRVRIPPDDSVGGGGGPKYLYFNPDDPSNRGEGDTFRFTNYSVEDIVPNFVSQLGVGTPVNGTRLYGNLTSFKEFDNDSYVCESLTNNMTIETSFNLENITAEALSVTLDNTNVAFYHDNAAGQFLWSILQFHVLFFHSLKIELATNVQDVGMISNASIFIKNYTSGNWVYFPHFDIVQQNETLLTYRTTDPIKKIDYLYYFVNFSNNNSVEFQFRYNGTGMSPFNVSINQFTIEYGELLTINNTIVPYDPLVTELIHPTEINVVNGTDKDNDPYNVRLNDNNFYEATADTNNLSIEFKTHVLPDINSSVWDTDYWDWWYLYPNPLAPQIDLRVSSNVSIDSPYNLSIAALEVYKGNRQYDFLNASENAKDWLMFGKNKDYTFIDETQMIYAAPFIFTWIIFQLMNRSDDNSLILRLRYVGNNTFEKFNVSVDEFSAFFYIQNVISSDITSKIGLGLDSNKIQPSDIQLMNFGINVQDDVYGKGDWVENITDGVPDLGIFEFNVTSIWNIIEFDVSGTYRVFQYLPQIELLDVFKVQYMIGTNYFSAKLTYWNGDPIESVNVVFEVLDSKDRIIAETTAVTNEQGIASASLEFTETGDSYKIRVRFEEEGVFSSSETSSSDFRIVNEFIIIMDVLIALSPYITIFMAILVLTAYIMHRKKTKLREIWAGNALVLDDLLKISYILIIHKDIGVALYSQQVSYEELDSDLISGFLHAISQFRQELKRGIKEEPTVGKTMEMDYYESKIIITDGNYIRVALILDGNPSDDLKENHLAFTNHFEKIHGAFLDVDSFDGDVTGFRDTHILVEKYFNISLMYPLQLGRVKDKNITELQRALLNVAEQMEKEKNFFFMSTLINYGIASRKEPRDQIINAIFSLRERNFIVPMKTE